MIPDETAVVDPQPNVWRLTVDVPARVDQKVRDRIGDAVADAAFAATPPGVDWDVFITGTLLHDPDWAE